jgi:hypothetical protein
MCAVFHLVFSFNFPNHLILEVLVSHMMQDANTLLQRLTLQSKFAFESDYISNARSLMQ